MALPWPRGKGMLQVLIQYLLAAAFVSLNKTMKIVAC